MNKTDLIEIAAIKTSNTKETANTLLNAFINAITRAVADGEKVTIVGFGSFEARDRKAREGRNPKTGLAIQIPATVVPVFSPGKKFREAIKC